MAGYLRLRQICLVADDIERTVGDLAAVFDIEVCHRDPNVAKYGLVNALLPVGTSFLEVVAPVSPDTAAGRFLQRRGGPAGYMVINDCEDNAPFRERAKALGIRAIEDRVYPGAAHLLQLHPRDTGGCILEFDHHVGGDKLDGAYQWAGPEWQQHVRDGRVLAITGAVLHAQAPRHLAERWAAVYARPLRADGDDAFNLALDNATLRFLPSADARDDTLACIDLKVRDPAPILASAAARDCAISREMPSVTIGGVEFNLQE